MASRDQIVEALHAENVLARRYFWPGCMCCTENLSACFHWGFRRFPKLRVAGSNPVSRRAFLLDQQSGGQSVHGHSRLLAQDHVLTTWFD